MKDLMQAIQNHDGRALSRLAGGAPQHTQREEQAALVFNDLFRQLRATFPALSTHVKTQDDLDEFRRTWICRERDHHHGTGERRNADCPPAGNAVDPVTGSVRCLVQGRESAGSRSAF